MSCGLLIAAGLMIKSVVQLKNVQMPFAIENVLTARVDLPRASYPDSAASIRFFEQLLPRLQARAGRRGGDAVGRAAGGRQRRRSPVQIEGKAYRAASEYPLAREGIVTAGYFETFQTHGDERPRVHGRPIPPTSQPVAIVNESFARTHFPNVDPIGRQFKRIRPAIERAVADDRRRRAGSDHGGDRQQQREPGRLLHSDRAERRRQRRAHRGAHARRAAAR